MQGRRALAFVTSPRKDETVNTQITWLDSALDEARLKAELELSCAPDGPSFEPAGEPNCTLIQTTKSIYLFLRITPVDRRGLLVGGALGECPATAVLVGAIPEVNDASEYPSCLKTGSRAVFIIESDRSCKRVVTSSIVSLSHARVHSRATLATIH
jgi:hypothetical protein